MPYLFTRLNFEVPFSGAEYLNESDVSRVISAVTPQPGFFNWLFGGSSASLTSYDGAHVMTPADATLTKNYGDNYVQLSSSTGTLKNGLQTEWGIPVFTPGVPSFSIQELLLRCLAGQRITRQVKQCRCPLQVQSCLHTKKAAREQPKRRQYRFRPG